MSRVSVPLALVKKTESAITSRDEADITNGYVFFDGMAPCVTKRPGYAEYLATTDDVIFSPFHDAERNVWTIDSDKNLYKNDGLATNLSTDWLPLATFSNDNAVGTTAWTNASNAASSNNTYATAAASNSTTNYLKAVDLSTLSLPALSTIVGIEARVEKKHGTVTGVSPTATGFTFPTAAESEDSVGDVDAPWTNPTRATANDGSFADAPALCTTQYLYVSDFNFAIPDDATITGVEVKIERRNDGGGGNKDDSLRLFVNGAATGDNKADTVTLWTSSFVEVTYGSSSDVWGAALTPALVNLSSFGVGLSVLASSVRSPEVDYISINIHYVTPPVDSTVKLVIGGVVSGTNKASADYWTSSDAFVTYGGPLDLWGTTPSQADVEGATFGIVFSAILSGAAATLSVDTIEIKIHYQSDSGSNSLTSLYTSNGITWAESDKYIYIHGGGDGTASKRDYYIYKDVVASGAIESITDADHPLVKATPDESPPGTVGLDGFFFIIGNHTATSDVDTGYSRIYNSDINAPSSWASTGFIASSKPGYLKYLAKHHNNIVAFGDNGIEFFYNAGNPSGSPLARRLDLDYSVGIVSHALDGAENNSHSMVAQYGHDLFFLGRPTNGGMGIYRLKDFKLELISSPAINNSLSEDSVVRGILSFENKDFLIVNSDWEDTTSLVYDIELDTWYEWSVNYNRGVSFTKLAIGDNNFLYETSGHTDDDATFEFSITTSKVSNVQGEKINSSGLRKFCKELYLIADRRGTSTPISISYTDDDYQSFSTARTLDINDPNAKLTRLGWFRDRAFRLSNTASYNVKLYDLVIDMDSGNS